MPNEQTCLDRLLGLKITTLTFQRYGNIKIKMLKNLSEFFKQYNELCMYTYMYVHYELIHVHHVHHVHMYMYIMYIVYQLVTFCK